MLAPKTNSLTFWPTEVSQEMNGITFFVCSTLWISRCILVAISVIFFLTIRLESRAPCRKEVRRRLRMKALRRRKRSHVWCCASKGVRKFLHFTKFGLSGQSKECRWKKRSRTSIQATGATRLKFKSWIFSSESTRECSASIQETGAGGSKPNRKWQRKYSNSRGSRKLAASSPELENMDTRTINTWARSFSLCETGWECPQLMEHSQWKHTKQMYSYGECLWLRRWKPPSTSGRIMCRIRKSTRTRNSRILKVYSTLLKSWQWNILKKFRMWNAWSIHHLPGRDQYYLMIMRSNGQRQKYVSMLIPFHVLDRWETLQKQKKDGKVKWKDSGCVRLTKMQW